jgi:hypothetical protein
MVMGYLAIGGLSVIQDLGSDDGQPAVTAQQD